MYKNRKYLREINYRRFIIFGEMGLPAYENNYPVSVYFIFACI